MIEQMFVVAGGVGIFFLVLCLVSILGVVIWFLILWNKARVRVPKGVEVLFKNTDYPRYVNVTRRMRVDLAVAKMHTGEIIHDALDRLFGENPYAYYYGSYPEDLGVVNEGRVNVISENGLALARREGDHPEIRIDMNIHIDALTPVD